ncbi:MAG: SIMPL domain-containing protein, partial [Burkholderiales bacterium]
ETRSLDRLGELIDIATQAGANQVQRIVFTLSDPADPGRRALRDAVKDAQAEAAAIAAALGATLGPVQSVVEQEMGPIRPFMQDAVMARAEAAATPIEPGMVSVRARVVVRIQIAR